METVKTIAIEAQRVTRAKKHGMDFVALNYINALGKNYPNHKFIVFTKKGDDDKIIPHLPNLRIIYIPNLPYPIWEQIALPYYCKKFKVDVLHCTSNTAPIFLKSKLVLTLHDIIFMESNPLKDGSLYQRFGNLYRRWIVPNLVKKAKSIITVSNYEKENIKRRWPKHEDKIETVYNAVNDHFWSFPSNEEINKAKELYQLPDRYFVFLGNTDPKKNVSNLFKAFYNLWKDFGDKTPKLVVPDYPASWLNEWFLENGADQNFKDFIFCSSYIHNKDLQCILTNAIAFLYPSKRESFGIPILEGFLSKVPVITSGVAAMPEVAGDAAILVDPLKPEDIKKALIQVLNQSSEERETIVEQGYLRAHQFNWDSSAKQLMAIYKRV
ncbi:glycosyltransferase family 4 protein [Luteibaculum oceani]|uniref:Glycosyltransferase family 4 protein n=1 Tax=Luteibaculum oceani TaxID=1294296 RepID=A0A5C6UYI9_9FLAO|nr:glycosyltransferase family 1 protein [Luteibaculum oceani]TXC77126.1 glycosyltransferase family 4 protein [Luteibaculum oceani]